MKTSRFFWTAWAILPALALAYHFGPGQRLYAQAKASRVLVEADQLQANADRAQDRAYEAHLAAISARFAARENPDDTRLAHIAEERTAAESEAYGDAAAAWTKVAEAYGIALTTLADGRDDARNAMRLARARALVRSGDLDSGVAELDSILETTPDNSDLAIEAREEFATAYYFGARALRVQGAPTSEWKQVAAIARENYRYIAEHAALNQRDADEVVNMQRNGELVLNLEQSALNELLARPRPRASPGDGVCKAGTLPGKGLAKGRKNNRGERSENPANGAGNLGEIGDGW